MRDRPPPCRRVTATTAVSVRSATAWRPDKASRNATDRAVPATQASNAAITSVIDW